MSQKLCKTRIFIKNKLLFFFGVIGFLMISACEENQETFPNDTFITEALTSATTEQLIGKWTILELEFEGKTTEVPASFAECGRDFFEFKENGEYLEYLFNDNTECTPQINKLSWSLTNGVINSSNGTQTDQLVITELSENRLVFKFRLETSVNGYPKFFKAICNRYQPPNETDVYSDSFQWDTNVENLDKILLRWNTYEGFNQFDRYEIYRLDANCNAANAELVSTITDVNQSSFTDLTPPPYENICYFFRIYTNGELLGESDTITVDTSQIIVPNINAITVSNINNSFIDLNWEQYQGNYFSHYEIEARNYSSGSGGGFQAVQLAEIDSLATLNYNCELPYFSNPVFVVHVHNIFGSVSQTVIEGQNQQSTNFVRDEILPINFITFSAFSPNETVLYYSDYSTLYRYNYTTKTVEAADDLNSSSIVFLKVFESSYGTEVIVNTGSEVRVYDPNLNFKYSLNIPVFNIEHLIKTFNDYWIVTDRERIYSFFRNESNFNLISVNDLYNQSFSNSRINIMDIGQDRVLVGNYTQAYGIQLYISGSGVLSNPTPVNLNPNSQWKNNSLFSEPNEYILNLEDKTIHSTNTYSLITTLNQSFTPTGIGDRGSIILGTNNNPVPSVNSFHEKRVRTLSYPNFTEQVYDTKGYPHIVHQNHLGQIISVSKGLIGSLDYSTVERDIFIEIVE